MHVTQPAPSVVILDREELHPLAASDPDGPFAEMLEDIYDDDERYEPWEAVLIGVRDGGSGVEEWIVYHHHTYAGTRPTIIDAVVLWQSEQAREAAFLDQQRALAERTP